MNEDNPSLALATVARQIQQTPTITPSHELTLSLISAAQHALELASTPAQVKYARDGLQTLKDIYKRRHANHLDRNLIAIQVVHADYRLGGMLKDLPRKQGNRPRPNSYSLDKNYLSPYQEGLSEMQKEATDRLVVTSQKLYELTDKADFDTWSEQHLEEDDFEVSTYAFLSYWLRMHREDDDTPPVPTGKFSAIVIDPPWPMEKLEREVRPNQFEFAYGIKTLEQIADLEIPCAEDCHVWLWTTQRFMPDAFSILEAWGLKYVCTFVWHKPGGFQPFGLPQYNSEFALYAHMGAPTFLDTKDFKTCFNAPRGEHSEKPAAFYEMVKRVTPAPRLDMFNRREIEGFKGWGKEAPSNREHGK